MRKSLFRKITFRMKSPKDRQMKCGNILKIKVYQLLNTSRYFASSKDNADVDYSQVLQEL